MNLKVNDIVRYDGKEYFIMRFQPEGIRLKGTKNNPLGSFEIVVDEAEIKVEDTQEAYVGEGGKSNAD